MVVVRRGRIRPRWGIVVLVVVVRRLRLDSGLGDYAVGVRENDSKWRDALNFALQDMWKDGAWDKIYATWIGPGTKLNLEKAEIGFKMEVWE